MDNTEYLSGDNQDAEDALVRRQQTGQELDKDELLIHGFSYEEIQAIVLWRWRPFAPDLDAAATEQKRMSVLGGLYPGYLVQDDDPEEVERKVKELSVRLFLTGHVPSLTVGGGVVPLVEAIRRWLPDFDLVTPDWHALERTLVDGCGVPPLELEKLTLVQIRRVLDASASKANLTPKPKPKSKPIQQAAHRPFTDQELEMHEMVSRRRMTQAEVASTIYFPRIFVLAALCCVFAAVPSSYGDTTRSVTSKPNVVILYGDDVGYGDVGVYGSVKIPTPHLDRLAAEGLRFTDGHCAAATCTPSRYSLLTGEMAFRKPGTGIARGNAKMVIDPQQYTLADVFQRAGYKTAVIGKWHLGLGSGQIDWNGVIQPGPEALGFDHYFIMPATNDRTPCIYIENGRVVNLDPDDPITVSYGKRIPDSVPGTKYPDARLNPEAITAYKGDGYHSATVINGIGRIGYMKGGKRALFKDEDMADDYVRQAGAFIRANKDRRFFLFFSASDIHAPRWPHQRFRGKSQHGLRGDAMVSFDWSCGAILKLLDELGLADNTLVIATSDNGPVYIDGGYQDGCETRGSSGSDHGHDASGIFRGGKYQIYEGGTRVPFIVRWPGVVKPGVSDALISQVDLLASFAAMLDQKVPPGQARDSRNLLNALLGQDKQGAGMILEQARGVAIRRGQWKYIGAEPQLYDLSKDPSETENLVEKNPQVAEELKQLLDRYSEQTLNR